MTTKKRVGIIVGAILKVFIAYSVITAGGIQDGVRDTLDMSTPAPVSE